MASVGTSFNPTAVMMGRPTSGSTPYLWSGAAPKPPIRPGSEAPAPSAAPASPSGTVGPRTIRATGSGPFDSAYRQNLASYAGGQFSGATSFNPTDLSTFPGAPSGGGNAPVAGMPSTLLDQALGGQSFAWTPPTAPVASSVTPGNTGNLQQWMNQFLMNGRSGRMGSALQ